MKTTPFPLLLLFLFEAACVLAPIKPNLAPQLAVFSGGIIGGTWIECDSNDKIRNCKIYNYTGRLYEEGQFEYRTEINKCDPNYILSDYHFKDGFLFPISIKQNTQNLIIQGFYGDGVLENDIKEKYSKIANINIERIEITYFDKCKNGRYIAHNIENNSPITGRIWNNSLYQIWNK